MRVFTVVLQIILLSMSILCSGGDIEGLVPLELKCEYSVNPLGVENKNPRLSWVLQSDVRSQKQTAYEILVSSSDDKLMNNEGDLWSSGKVESDRSVY
ncbi:alpha-rhamnosidase, partial [bacterium]|nr:alpha-rhamnosidase [bacterium]